MRKAFLIFLSAVLLLGCRKAKEKAIIDTLAPYMSETEWKVTAFSDGPNNLDAAFQPFLFRFNPNETVDAYRNSVKEATGAWKASLTSRTIQSNFQAGTVHPLPLLNTTWTITENTFSSLTATATVGGVVRVLKMQKL